MTKSKKDPWAEYHERLRQAQIAAYARKVQAGEIVQGKDTAVAFLAGWYAPGEYERARRDLHNVATGWMILNLLSLMITVLTIMATGLMAWEHLPYSGWRAGLFIAGGLATACYSFKRVRKAQLPAEQAFNAQWLPDR